MKKKIIFLLILLCALGNIGSTAIAQSYVDWDSYDISGFYKKIELESGALDEDGDDIDFLFVPTQMEYGLYEVQVADGPGNLYAIKGTDIYVEFRSYYGYAGYGDDGVLKVESSYYYSTFYKQ